MFRAEEYTSDEGNYSSISSTSGLSGYDEEFNDFQSLQSTDTEKQQLLLFNQNKFNPDINFGKNDNKTKSIWNRVQYENASDASEKLRILQQINEDNVKENDQLHTQIFQDQREIKQLKQEVYQLNNDKDCRENCIRLLKDKIKEQQEEIQKSLQQNFKLNIELSSKQNELISVKSTIDWYKSQYQSIITERNTLLQESLELKSTVRCKKLEIRRLETLLHDLQQQQIKQATNAFQSTEKIVEKKTPEVICNFCNNESNSSSEYYQSEIDILSREINTVKNTLTKQTELLTILVEEKSEILKQHAILQELQNNTQKKLQREIKEKQSLCKTNDNLLAAISLKDQQLLDLKTQRNNISIEITTLLKEKHTVHELINKTRNSFHKLLSMKEEFKEKLKQKEKIILNLEKKLQDNFMRENWNKCANEELVSKEAGYINKIHELNLEITNLKKDVNTKDQDNTKLVFELNEIKKYCKDVLHCNKESSDKLENDGCERNDCPKLTQNSESIINLMEICHKYGITTSVNIKEIVNNISIYLERQTQEKQCDCKQLVKEIKKRCENVSKRCSDAEDLSSTLRKEILMLRDKIHLKEAELCNKQKRYELYYRTLLKNVKEQKYETQSLLKENNALKQQQHNMIENMNTMKLQLCQEQITNENINLEIVKKTEIIQKLQSIVKDIKNDSKLKDRRIHELENKEKELCCKYDEMVSTLSNRSRDNIETDVRLLQEKLDFYENEVKIANCTLNTNTIALKKFENEKKNALKLITALIQTNSEHVKHVQTLIKEKAFLERLIIDLRAALNASTAKSKICDETVDIVPFDFNKFSCPLIPDETEILELLQEKQREPVFEKIKSGLCDLRNEVSSLYIQINKTNA